MAKFAFTQRFVDSLRPPPPDGKPAVWWDTTMPGFGIRISPQNRRVWIVAAKIAGKLETETLATTAIMPKLVDARAKARTWLQKAKEGINPVETRKADDARKAHEAAVNSITFRTLVDAYVEEYCRANIKPSSLVEVSRHLDRAAKFFGAKPLKDIDEADIVDMISVRTAKGRASRNGGLSEADNRLQIVRRCFRWAKRTVNLTTRQRWVAADPSADILRPMKPVERERVLDNGEIIRFWQACGPVEAGGIGWPFGPLFQLMLLLGQREGEVAGMRWSELDLTSHYIEVRDENGQLTKQQQGLVWKLPAAPRRNVNSRTKNSKAHTVALSDQAREIIESLPRIEPLPGRPDFVFTTTRTAPVSGFTEAKRHVDKRMGGGEHWQLHDLRRTMRSGMGDLRIAPHIGERVLNHAVGGKIARIYDKAQYSDECRAALQAWGRYVEGLIDPERGRKNVVALRAGR
jgi:integrase